MAGPLISIAGSILFVLVGFGGWRFATGRTGPLRLTPGRCGDRVLRFAEGLVKWAILTAGFLLMGSLGLMNLLPEWLAPGVSGGILFFYFTELGYCGGTGTGHRSGSRAAPPHPDPGDPLWDPELDR